MGVAVADSDMAAGINHDFFAAWYGSEAVPPAYYIM